MRRSIGKAIAASLWVAALAGAANAAETMPPGYYARNLEPLAYHNLDDRPAFKISVVQAGERWYLYLGHFWVSGWTILDVTDPAEPKIVKFIPGPEGSFTGQVDISGTTMITALQKPLVPRIGASGQEGFEEGVLIWDIRDPVNPRQVGHYRTQSTGTHRNFYAGGKYMHLAAAAPGFRGNIYSIVDISDPSRPVEAGRWWVKGQAPGEEPPSDPRVSHHGPAYVVGSLVYLSYGAAGMIIVDISDVAKPRQVGGLSFAPPFDPTFAVHTVVPLPERKIALVNSESIIPQCTGPLNFAGIVDIADPAKPRLMSLFPTPLPPAQMGKKSFCEIAGSIFGPHNVNTLLHNPFVQPQGDLVYLTYWNGGLRLIDIASLTAPREVGYFISPVPRRRYGRFPQILAPQSEDVLVDKRGYIYVTDNNQGIWILRQREGYDAAPALTKSN